MKIKVFPGKPTLQFHETNNFEKLGVAYWAFTCLYKAASCECPCLG